MLDDVFSGEELAERSQGRSFALRAGAASEPTCRLDAAILIQIKHRPRRLMLPWRSRHSHHPVFGSHDERRQLLCA
jgi:hypothetical protein